MKKNIYIHALAPVQVEKRLVKELVKCLYYTFSPIGFFMFGGKK